MRINNNSPATTDLTTQNSEQTPTIPVQNQPVSTPTAPTSKDGKDGRSALRSAENVSANLVAEQLKSNKSNWRPLERKSVMSNSDNVRVAGPDANGTATKTLSLKAEPNAAIKDNQSTSSVIKVDDDITLDKLTVSLDVAHSYRGDLEVTLTSPSGEKINLHNRTGGSADNLQFTVDRAEFAGKAAKGDWTLTVSDKARADEGVLKSWGLDLIGKVKESPKPPAEEEIVVAVFDGGVDYNHTDLDSKMWVNKGEVAGDGIDNDNNGVIDDVHGINLGDGTGDPFKGKSTDHGTHVAGIITAEDNGFGNTGVAANANVKILSAGNIYQAETAEDFVANFERGVDYILKQKENGVNVRVINCSFGIVDDKPENIARWNTAVNKLADAGIFVVVSAGNASSNVNDLKRFPTTLSNPNVITIGNLGTNGKVLASSSNFGDKVVEIAAPGERILSTIPGNKHTQFSGTSMAAPLVAGVAALLVRKNPDLTPVQIRDILMTTVDVEPGLQGKVSTGGKLNIERAIAKAEEMRQTPNA